MLVDREVEGEEGKDYIVCRECGKKLRFLGNHFWRCPGSCKTFDEYVKKYPDAPTICQATHNIQSEKCSMKDPKISARQQQTTRDNGHYLPGSERNKKVSLGKKGNKNPMRRPEIAAKTSISMVAYFKDNPEARARSSRAGKLVHELHPNLWQNGLKYLNDNSPFRYMGVGWCLSSVQRDITRLLFEKLGIVPIKGVNCQIYDGRNEFDFMFLGMIYEPHSLEQPFREAETKEEYIQRRLNDLDNAGINKPLKVTTSRKEATEFINWLGSALNGYLGNDIVEQELQSWSSEI